MSQLLSLARESAPDSPLGSGAFSRQLLSKIKNFKKDLLQIDIHDSRVVERNLIFLYHSVMASEQLLIDGLLLALNWDDAPVRNILVKYYSEHLDEERGHINWLREDLSENGIIPGFPDPIAMAMTGTQYYLIKHVHPAALLGYLAVVEGDPVTIDTIEILEKIYGASLFKFMRMHAERDIIHSADLFYIIDKLPSYTHGYIEKSAQNTLHCFSTARSQWLLTTV